MNSYWLNICKNYIYTFDKSIVNRFIIDKNYKKKRLNAERNEILRQTIVSFILSPNLYHRNYAPNLYFWCDYVGIFDRLTSLSSRGKHCHVCNHSLVNCVRYKYKSKLYDTKIITCSDCMTDVLLYTKKQVIEICKEETYKLFSLLKKTPYDDLCSDVFNIIFIFLLKC